MKVGDLVKMKENVSSIEPFFTWEIGHYKPGRLGIILAIMDRKEWGGSGAATILWDDEQLGEWFNPDYFEVINESR